MNFKSAVENMANKARGRGEQRTEQVTQQEGFHWAETEERRAQAAAQAEAQTSAQQASRASTSGRPSITVRSRTQSNDSMRKGDDIDLEKGRDRSDTTSSRPPPLYTPKPPSASLPPRKPPQIVIVVNESKDEGRDNLGSKKGSHLLKIGFFSTVLSLSIPLFFLVMEKNALRNDMHWWGACFAESFIFFPAMLSCFIPAYLWAASWVHPEELEKTKPGRVFWNHLWHWKDTKGGDFTTKSMQLLLSYAAIFTLWNHFSKVDGLITMGTRRIARKERNKNSYKLLQRIDRSAVKMANSMEDQSKDDRIARLEAILKERFPIVKQTIYVPSSSPDAKAKKDDKKPDQKDEKKAAKGGDGKAKKKSAEKDTKEGKKDEKPRRA